jgi:hypothetical protein
VTPNLSLSFSKKILLSGRKKKVVKAIMISEDDHLAQEKCAISHNTIDLYLFPFRFRHIWLIVPFQRLPFAKFGVSIGWCLKILRFSVSQFKANKFMFK